MLCVLGLVSGGVCAQPVDLENTLPESQLPALKRLLESAVQQAPEVIARQLEVALSQARIYAADAPRIPRLSGGINYDSSQSAVSGSNSRTNRDNGLFYRIELSQSLFHWGALKNESARGRIGVAIADKNYREVYRVLALGIRQSYLELVGRKAQLVQLRYAQKLRTDDLEVEKDNLKNGVTAEGVVAGLQLALDANAIELERQEADFKARCQALSRIAGAAALTEEDVPAEMPSTAIPPELAKNLVTEFLRGGASSALEVQLWELKNKDADLAYKVARVRSLPKFGTSVGHSVENTTNVTGASVDQQGVERQTIRVTADWAMFDWANRGAKKETLASKRIIERQLVTSKERLMEEAQRLEKSIAIEAKAVAMADYQQVLAVAELDLVSQEAGRGLIPRYEIDKSTGNLNVQKMAQAMARARLVGEWCAFVSLAGIDPALKKLPGYVR